MVEPITASLILGIVVKQVFSTLAAKGTGVLLERLRGDPARKAFAGALAAALERFAVGPRLAIAEPLLRGGGVLADPEVAAELAEILRFERDPDVTLIAARWRAALPAQAAGDELDDEVRQLLEYLRQELRATDTFRPVFDAKSLDAIAESAQAGAESLERVERRLEELTALLSAGFGELALAFRHAPPNVQDSIRDFSGLIVEKTTEFVGREHVFDALDAFVGRQQCGYLLIRGDPGIGKSAVMAELVKRRGYVHHFNVRAEGIDRADAFLTNVIAQVIATRRLEWTAVPADAGRDAGFLNRVLAAASEQLGDEHLTIVVDALDEVDLTRTAVGANVLMLPQTLPRGVYIVASARLGGLPLRAECAVETFALRHDSSENRADIRRYLERRCRQGALSGYLRERGLDPEAFVDAMVDRSEGNFIYLRHVLPEIEHGNYRATDVDHLPLGLVAYYEDHWSRMRGLDESAWFAYRLPVLVALTAARKPVSAQLLARFAGVAEVARVRAVLTEWAEFLHEGVEHLDGRDVRVYRIYHASFEDFIAAKEEVDDERVSLRDANDRIADDLWAGLYGGPGPAGA